MMKLVTLSANNPGVYTGRTGNNTYLLLGAAPTLIDAGVGDPAHVDAIADALAGAGSSTLAQVIVTHAHPDHASGAAALGARFPGARFLKYPNPERDGRYPVRWEPLADGDEVAAGDERLVVAHTPGHAPDHVALWHAPTRSLFCGDLAVRGTTVVIPGGRGGSVAAYLRSLERVRALDPAVLLPAHGPAIHDVGRLIAQYVAHRQEREEQIVDRLASGSKSVEELLRELYPSIHPKLADAARGTIVAHLEKLQDDHRACTDSDARWALHSGSRYLPKP